MSKMPKMNLWIDAFNSDTCFLTNEELGVYFRLIFYAWSKEGYLPNDKDFILNLAPNSKPETIDYILKLFWKYEGSDWDKGWYQKRLVSEYQRAVSLTETNRENAKKRYAIAEPSQSDRIASISNSISISKSNKNIIDNFFNKFWEDVCYKINKGQARRNYRKLHKDWLEEPQMLSKKYNEYYESLKDKQFAQHPSTWLNAEGFLNEGTEVKDKLTDQEMKDWKFKSDMDMRKQGIKPLSWSVGYIRELDEAIAKSDS